MPSTNAEEDKFPVTVIMTREEITLDICVIASRRIFRRENAPSCVCLLTASSDPLAEFKGLLRGWRGENGVKGK